MVFRLGWFYFWAQIDTDRLRVGEVTSAARAPTGHDGDDDDDDDDDDFPFPLLAPRRRPRDCTSKSDVGLTKRLLPSPMIFGPRLGWRPAPRGFSLFSLSFRLFVLVFWVLISGSIWVAGSGRAHAGGHAGKRRRIGQANATGRFQNGGCRVGVRQKPKTNTQCHSESLRSQEPGSDRNQTEANPPSHGSRVAAHGP